MVRFLWLHAFNGIHTVLFCIWGIMLSPFDKNGRKVHLYAAVPWAKLILWSCGIKVTPKGNENIDPKVSRIYMTNHQSYFDIFALLAYLPVDFKFVMKQELMRIPLFGLAMRKAGYIGIERDDPKKAILSMNKAAERIKGGASLVVFPEGTRGIGGELQPFKRGGFTLALKTGCDIVPVAICNSYKIVPKGSLKINRGGFELTIGKPISVQAYYKKDINQLMDRVRDNMLGLM
ncbi:MAG: 1-acyl-sn-glycerol-3-phosphate acyltransferase [Deltaproteobacteria bacterium]|nr:1-acyl-sn-glycerol-3-phosphate acyltransferase [Deltaproteobacteria bacterium]MBW1736624.1 1-acyl-sn-glycerol-3-phosphate acyltransferase [Deltaproteobacteria bacterium]MBW1908845.1 1-acyl-sn-glycerol-3-phosphate acyltransferase [Deltaproteobacteria bacterium]MBW2033150.1 1-acyl-sn-glycerol-3-phosphate acyltransferase [Deltaproteobacteria bacterium]MBW2114204.1 1-acyl-sn-glycerol-3-phosphate acyltransferase [Deltaproteobacteria bacterium]